MKRPARRTFIKIIALLAAGAAVNVAVAWGCKLNGPTKGVHKSDADEMRFQNQALEHCATSVGEVRRSFFFHSSGPGVDMLSIQIWGGERPGMTEYWRYSSGWPMLSMVAQNMGGYASMEAQEKFLSGGELKYESAFSAIYVPLQRRPELAVPLLPTQPLWPGFAVNTLFYAVVLWVLCCGPLALRRMIRRRRGRCAACAYPTWGGGQSPVCTECGAPRPAV